MSSNSGCFIGAFCRPWYSLFILFSSCFYCQRFSAYRNVEDFQKSRKTRLGSNHSRLQYLGIMRNFI